MTNRCACRSSSTFPGLPAHVVAGPVQLIDIAPTILGLLDLLAPARMRGTDLGPWLATPPAPDDRLPPVVRRG